MENLWLDPVVSAYRKYFRNDDAEIIFDVGTRDGDDAEFLREKLNAQYVYAIDANPVAVQYTQDAYPGFTVVETAITDFDGEIQFFQNLSEDKNVAGTSSIDYSTEGREELVLGTARRIKARATRLDSLLEELDLLDKEIDVMKIDLETYSYEALIGLGRRIFDVKIFHLETERQIDRETHKNNSEVAKFMRQNGFWLCDVSYEWGHNIQDQVWINKRLAKYPPIGVDLDEKK